MSIDPDRFRRPSAEPAPPRPATPRPLTDVSAPELRRTAPPVNDVTPEPEPVLPHPQVGRRSAYIEPKTEQPAVQRVASPVAPPKKASDGATNVTININMPKFKKPTLPDWPWKKIRKYAIIVGILIIVSVILRLVIGFAVEQHRQNELKNRLDRVEQQRITPDYKPLTPTGRTASVTKQAAFDGKRGTYSFTDMLKGTSLTVSQQPLPAGGDKQLATIAKSINATTPLTLNGGSAYLASDKASNGQMIVATKRGMLIFVQSAFTHSAEDWKQYLDNLAT